MIRLLYWECDKPTWDHIRRLMAPHAKSMHNLLLDGIEVRIREGVQGWHPVYQGDVPRWGACCPFEKRSLSGGCMSCGDPCL